MRTTNLAGLLLAAAGLVGCSASPDDGTVRAPSPLSSIGVAEVATVEGSRVSAPTVAGPDNVWTWIDQVPGVKCADGSASGFAVNPLSTGNGKVMIFLEGGGFCDDDTTCNSPFKTTTHLNYNASTFASEMTSSSSKSEAVNLAPFGSFTWSRTQGTRGIWDRTSTSNPFRSYNFVFIPQCTADLYMGDRQDTSSAFPSARTPSQDWFVGSTNFGIFAHEVHDFFPSPASIALVGGSAGGFGAIFNYPQLKALYPEVPFSVIADSATPFWTGDPSFTPRQGFWMRNFEPAGVPSYEEDFFADAWGLDATHPAGVVAVTRAGAERSIYPQQAILLANAGTSSDVFGFIQASNDWVTPWYLHLNVNGLSHPNISDAQTDFDANVKLSNVHTSWIASTKAPDPNLRVWNQHHGFILDDVSLWTQSGVLPWLTDHFSL